MSEATKCQGCENDHSDGLYLVTYEGGEMEQVRYCYECRDIVTMAIEAEGRFEAIVSIQSA